MITLKSQYDESAVTVEFTLHSDSTLTEVLETFEHFLRSTGYSFNGHLDICANDDSDTECPRDLGLPF